MVVKLAAAAALCVSVASAQAAPAAAAAPCVVDTLHAGFPAQWLGTRVGQITIRARNVEAPNAIVETAVHYLHRPTQLAVVANELSFAAGDAVDSLAVLESVRRLRRTALFSEVLLEGTRCEAGNPTDFTIWTRDAWSVRADFRMGRTSSRASLSDINMWGTGRSLTLRAEEIEDRRSFTVSYVAPYLFGSPFRGAALLRNYEDGRAWQWSVRTRDFSPRDVWRAALLSSQLRRLGDDSAAFTHTDIERRAAAASVSRRVILQRRSVWAVVAGVEQERADIAVYRPGPLLGKQVVKREFTAPLLGLQHRSMQFGAINWLVPGQAPAELPLGVDGDVVAALGHENRFNAGITHVDGWMGATALPAPGTILTGDVWWSGYWSRDSLSNGTVRVAAAVYQRARRGMWIVRGAVEHIYDPDPDVYALSAADPMLRLLTPASRLAESAMSFSVERSLHLRASEGRWVVDGAVFSTFSERHRSVDEHLTETQNPRALIVGIGLRHVRNQPTQAPIRLDIARAVWRSSNLPDRWIVVLSTVPWINAGRAREGLR